MADVVVARHDEPGSVSCLAEAVQAANPDYLIRAGTWDGEGDFEPETGGVRYLWPLDGQAEVLLPDGFRTQEGDGEPLPGTYRADPFPDQGLIHLQTLRTALAANDLHAQLRAPAGAICTRFNGRGYSGDIAGEIWLMVESGLVPESWAAEEAPRAALAWLIRSAPGLGWSTREAPPAWESILPGDQLIATGRDSPRLRGQFRYWSIEDTVSRTTRCGPVRRLRHLRDTAGGCSPGFDAFRRLNLTWRLPVWRSAAIAAALEGEPAPDATVPASNPDAPNRLNSHVLHIEAAQSRTHYHPASAVGGGASQLEFYFVLDAAPYGLHAPAGSVPYLYSFPDVTDWRRYTATNLALGTAVFIPPGTGHRGVDVFANVVTLPGFKPRNELYVDRAIMETGAGAPFNASAAGAS